MTTKETIPKSENAKQKILNHFAKLFSRLVMQIYNFKSLN